MTKINILAVAYKRYVPKSLSEVEDLLASLMGGAPKFLDSEFPHRNIDSDFETLVEGFEHVRAKLGEIHFAKLNNLASEAKALFLADPDDTDGQTDQGFKRLMEIDDILHEVRKQRHEARTTDEDGEVTGD